LRGKPADSLLAGRSKFAQVFSNSRSLRSALLLTEWTERKARMKHSNMWARASVMAALALGCALSGQAQVPTNGMTFWVRADVGVQTSGGFVTNWVNQAPGGGNDAAQTVLANQPTLVNDVINGQAVVRFDNNDLLRTPTPVQTSQTFSMFAVATLGQNSLGANGYVGPFHNGQEAFSTGYGFRRQGLGTYGLAFPNVAFVNFGPTIGTDIQLQDAHRTAGGVVTFYINGAQSGTAQTPGAPIVPTHSSQVGGSDIGFFIGDVAEVLVYHNALSASDRQEVQEYIFAKYGIPEPTVAALLAIGGLALLRRRRLVRNGVW
jgi:hypothetical protein